MAEDNEGVRPDNIAELPLPPYEEFKNNMWERFTGWFRVNNAVRETIPIEETQDTEGGKIVKFEDYRKKKEAATKQNRLYEVTKNHRVPGGVVVLGKNEIPKRDNPKSPDGDKIG